MLVSHAHRFIYLKTQKTAGTSTEVYFQSACMPPTALPQDWKAWHRTDSVVTAYGVVGARLGGAKEGFWNHMSARQVIDAVGPKVWASYLTFANVRNPWDKMVSHFFYDARAAVLAARPPTPEVEDEIRATFAAFIRKFRRPEVEALLLDPSYRLDAYIRYEHLRDDMLAVAQHCGLTLHDRPFPRLKTDARPERYRDYRGLYGEAERRHVADVYADWIAEFRYTF